MGGGALNFQNIPRHDKVVKRAFVPKRGAFSFFDYKSIEPVLAAFFLAKKGYPEFAEQITAGVDPYTAVAKMVTGKDVVSDEERQKWKIMYLSLLYGGGVRTIQEQFDVEYPAAKSMIRTFHGGWPAVRALSDDVQRVAGQRGFIRGLDGRHLHPEEFGEHKLLNKLIQGSAAGLMKQAMLNVHRWLRRRPKLESRMVSTVHDELIFDGPVSEVSVLHECVPPLMVVRHDVNEIVPIRVDHEVSVTTWADKVDYDEWLAATREEVAA